ncbi:MAG TPA: hypothetical protein VE736_13110 [Gaiellaceae bacterium]|jgi:hypothetical protein|nr:hypothetical protein [Gaiellaceae bacterium]
MNQARAMGLVAVAVAASTVAATVNAAVGERARSRPDVSLCGGNLWRLKTLSDGRSRSVDLSPRSTTIAAIRRRHEPRPIPTLRTTPFQRRTWAVPAQITRYWREGNELRLQLYDNNGYMNAVVPSPSCLSDTTRARSPIMQTWKKFMNHCGHATKSAQPLGAVVTVIGVGYWSERRARHGEAPNGAELHPVTGLRPVAGCGS